MVLRLTMLAVLLPLSNGLLISQQPRLRPSCRQAGASLRPSCRPCFMKAAGEAKAAKAAAVEPLPSTLLPITLSVFAQMLGEGIAISSLPLYMTNLGASPMQVGLATSCFSAAQMVCCPLLVSLSSRVGRALVLRVCLIGATASSLLIAGSGSISGILLGRLFAGIFAASVPVAQSAATDIVSGPQTARALSRVAAAAQAGVVVGPAASALIMEAAGVLGVPAPLRLRCAFAFSATLAAGILLASLSPRGKENAGAIAAGAADGAASGASVPPPPPPPAPPPPPVGVGRMAQPGLRLMAVIVGWALTLSVGTYGLFAPRVMGYRQPQLSATYSAGAATTILVQLAIFPRLVGRLGEHLAATVGLVAIALGLSGCSIITSPPPVHAGLYLSNRAGAGIADTSTATLVARSSPTKEARSRNLGLIQSARAAARIVTPVIAGTLFQRSCAYAPPFTGALPYLVNACCCLLIAPFPLLLRKAERQAEEQAAQAEEEAAAAS